MKNYNYTNQKNQKFFNFKLIIFKFNIVLNVSLNLQKFQMATLTLMFPGLYFAYSSSRSRYSQFLQRTGLGAGVVLRQTG